MSVVLAAIVAIFVIGAVLGLVAMRAPRKALVAPAPPPPPIAPWTASTDWTTQAGDEFAGLSESARCDLIFAVADLDDERSHQLLLHALDDPSDAVALAAAHALVRRGAAQSVTEHAGRFPGERANRILETLALLD